MAVAWLALVSLGTAVAQEDLYREGFESGSLSEWTRLVPPDRTSPAITILSPLPYGFPANDLPQIQISYSDGLSGINVSSLEVQVDGAEIGATCSVGERLTSCSMPVLSEGPHSVFTAISDLAGNRSNTSVDFTVLAPVAGAPRITVTRPGTTVVGDATPEIVLRLRNVVPSSLAVIVDGQDVTTSCSGDVVEQRCESPRLAVGEHRLEVSGQNSNGVRTTAVAVFEIDLDLDITILSPEEGFLTRETTVTVSGTVSLGATEVLVAGATAQLDGAGGFEAVQIPLREGANPISAVARTGEGGAGSAQVTVVRDTESPRIVLRTPLEGMETTSGTILVTGDLADPSSSAFRAREPRVTVNGFEATVFRKSFMVEDFLLQPGENRLEAIAVDAAGNVGRTEVRLTYRPDAPRKIEELQGNGQRGIVGQTLAQPLVVRLTDRIGNPVANRPVTFRVTRGDGTVASFPDVDAELTAISDERGVAQVRFALGRRTGSGNHEVTATSDGFPGQVVFCASADPELPRRILPIEGADQTGALAGTAGEALPNPLLVQVFDPEGNPVPDLAVIFEVLEGQGGFAGADPAMPQPVFVVRTDGEGKAGAPFVLGPEVGNNTNRVTASFAGLEEPPATFLVTGRAAGNEGDTAVVGLVTDNQDDPVPGVTVSIEETALSAITSNDGRFRISGAPVGEVHLIVDGRTTSVPGVWPVLAFEMSNTPGADNDLGMPIRLVRLDDDSVKTVGGDEDVTLRLKGVEGAELTVWANSVTFPDGSETGELSVTQVHSDKVPMVAPMGSNFMLAWTIQPAGVKFNPPARLAIPNFGEPPGAAVDIFSFDHDLGEFTSIGTATVSADGQQVVSDPGFGVVKSGWHGCLPPPRAPPADACRDGSCYSCPIGGRAPVNNCGPCERCVGNGGCEPLTLGDVEAQGRGLALDGGGADFQDVQILVGPGQEVEFRLDSEGTCQGEVSWDFGDGETETSEAPVHAFFRPGNYGVTASARCGCSNETASDSILVTVVPMNLQAHARYVRERAELTLEAQDDQDPEKAQFYWTLGGTRIRIEADPVAIVAARAVGYRWKADEGRWLESNLTDSRELTGSELESSSPKQVFFELDWRTDLDTPIHFVAQLEDGSEVFEKRRIRTRTLRPPSSPPDPENLQQGDDIAMLREALWLLGMSSGVACSGSQTCWGVSGDPVPAGSGIDDALVEVMTNFQKRGGLAQDGVFGNASLDKLDEVLGDYRRAVQSYPTTAFLDLSHPDAESWLMKAEVEIKSVYTEQIHEAVTSVASYERLLRSWIQKESQSRQWGYSGLGFRTVLGGGPNDNRGSIGFNQIQHRYKYNPANAVVDLNLYHPEDAAVGLAAWSVRAGWGTGLRRAFLGQPSPYTVERTYSEMEYPRLSGGDGLVQLKYTDTLKGLLRKGVFAYNRGAFFGSLTNETWPEHLRSHDASDRTDEASVGSAYAISILAAAGYEPMTWTWTDLYAITTGSDGVCQSGISLAGDDQFVEAADGQPNAICVCSGDDGLLETRPLADDQGLEFSFEYGESQWRTKKFDDRRKEAAPASGRCGGGR